MKYDKIKSHAKLNLSLNIVGKNPSLHKIETLVTFAEYHDLIMIRKSNLVDHSILFYGKFSYKISPNNTVLKLLKILEQKKILKKDKFEIKINKRIPSKAGLGGGSMNAASIFTYLIKKKIIRVSRKQIFDITKRVGSDVILGLDYTNSILNSKNEVKRFKNCQKIYLLIVKPNFGCSTKEIFKKVKKFDKPFLKKPSKKLFRFQSLIKMKNSLESLAFQRYTKLKTIKLFLESLSKPIFVRMTGSGSAIVAYFRSKERCNNAKKQFKKKYKKYWCIASKTI